MTHRRWYEDRPFVYAAIVVLLMLFVLVASGLDDAGQRITALEAKVNGK